VKHLPIYAIVLLSLACNAGASYEKAENAQDAGREFIRASLDGDQQKARFYMLKDSTNMLLIQRQQRDYESLSHEEKQKHRDSDIRPIRIQKVNDTTTTYEYCNTYNPKDTTTITIVKTNGDWQVDLKSILKK
jgi:hypothetical protein